MKVLLNGEPHELADGCDIGSLLATTNLAERKVAVEVNREIVPKSRHAHHILHEGDRVEMVHAMGGG